MDESISNKEDNEFLNFRQVIEMTKLGRTTIYTYMSNNIFPLPLKMGARKIFWKKSDIQKWITERHHATYGSKVV